MTIHDFPPLPLVLSSETVFNQFFRIQKDVLSLPDTKPYSYFSLTPRSNAVVVIGKLENGSFLLLKEYRHPTKTTLLSCPGGYVDEGEDVLEAADRELREETGYKAQKLGLLGRAFPYPGISSQEIFYVYGTGLKLVENPRRETSEIMQVLELKPDELEKAALSGVPLDGVLCAALYFLSLREKAQKSSS